MQPASFRWSGTFPATPRPLALSVAVSCRHLSSLRPLLQQGFVRRLRSISARSTVLVRRDSQHHSRSFCTMNAVCKSFCETQRPTSGGPAPMELRLSVVREFDRKEEMRAWPSDVRCFVQQTTSNQYWPVDFDHSEVKPLPNVQEGPGGTKKFSPELFHSSRKAASGCTRVAR
jgi:hypothetical protein